MIILNKIINGLNPLDSEEDFCSGCRNVKGGEGGAGAFGDVTGHSMWDVGAVITTTS